MKKISKIFLSVIGFLNYGNLRSLVIFFLKKLFTKLLFQVAFSCGLSIVLFLLLPLTIYAKEIGVDYWTTFIMAELASGNLNSLFEFISSNRRTFKILIKELDDRIWLSNYWHLNGAFNKFIDKGTVDLGFRRDDPIWNLERLGNLAEEDSVVKFRWNLVKGFFFVCGCVICVVFLASIYDEWVHGAARRFEAEQALIESQLTPEALDQLRKLVIGRRKVLSQFASTFLSTPPDTVLHFMEQNIEALKIIFLDPQHYPRLDKDYLLLTKSFQLFLRTHPSSDFSQVMVGMVNGDILQDNYTLYRILKHSIEHFDTFSKLVKS